MYDAVMRTTIDLPEPMLQNAKALAAQRHTTLSDVVEDALRSHLASRQASEVPEFRLHTVKGTVVDPTIDLDRTSSILIAEDEEVFGAGKRN